MNSNTRQPSRPTWRAPLLASLLVALVAPAATSAFYMGPRASPESQKWSYDNQSEWRQEFKECARNAQSPIDIQHRNVIHTPQLKLRFYNYVPSVRFNLENTHHTIKMSPVGPPVDIFDDENSEQARAQPAGSHRATKAIRSLKRYSRHLDVDQSSLEHSNHHYPRPTHDQDQDDVDLGGRDDFETRTSFGRQAFKGQQVARQRPEDREAVKFNGTPGIRLDWLDDGNNEFTLRDIHFHWGERKDNGSEHAIDGRRAAMEMHLVHVRNGLPTSQIAHESDAVVVLAVLIESYRKSNADFNPIVNALSRVNATRKVQMIEYKSLLDLLPSNLESFYTYSGSLTTPPCSQVVNWVVMTDRLYLNAKQIEMFRNLYAPPSQVNYVGANHHQSKHSDLHPLTPNVRALQPINNRTILASFTPFGRLEAWPNAVGAPNSAAKRVRVQHRASAWRAAACYGAVMLACAYLS